MAAPFVHLRLGYLDDRVLAPSDQVRQVDDKLRAEFGQGQTDVIDVVVPDAGATTATEEAAYATHLSQLPDVESVDSSSGIYVSGTHYAAPAGYMAQFHRGNGIWYSVVPMGDGLSSEGETLVHAIRDGPAPFALLVGGTPASLVDSTAVINHYLPLAVLIVVGATFLILLFLFRSLFIPLKALVLSVISLSATFGVMVWIFQEGHLSRLLDFTPTGTLIDTMPILMFCVAFGLSMDYEVFLVSRMKELHDNGAGNDAAIAGGMQQTGRIITAAALLMSIIFLSLLSSSISFIKLFAVGLALAVLMDAFVIRGMLVPAIMKLAGDANWWAPSFMRKVAPRPRPVHRSLVNVPSESAAAGPTGQPDAGAS
jgi:RND superfamily putative drug exporter